MAPALLLPALLLLSAASLRPQQAVELRPPAGPEAGVGVEPGVGVGRFRLVSDGPAGPGWTRPDEIARYYVQERLPALFERTLALDEAQAPRTSLRWIFTGPHAGLTVELSPTSVRLAERYYDSPGLWEGHGSYPERVILERERPFVGEPRTLTVIADAHLTVRVLVNGQPLLDAPLRFDLSRHQLMYVAPRTAHTVISGALYAPRPAPAVVALDLSRVHQEMLGFGGSPGIPAYLELSDRGREEYWKILARYHLLLSREYPMGTELRPDLSNLDRVADATPHYYGDNFPNGELSSFAYNRRIVSMGGQVIYEPWALPSWMEQPYNGPPLIDAWNRRVRREALPDEYARLVVAYCRREKAETGAAPAIVGLENEVEQPPAVFRAMALSVRRALDLAGFRETRIHMPDASFLWQGMGRAGDLEEDPAAWRAIDLAASHEYDFQPMAGNLDLYAERLRAMRRRLGGKPFLATEICFNDPQLQEPSYRIALVAAELYHHNLVDLDAVGLLYCWLLLDVEQPTFAGSRSLLAVDRGRGAVPVPSSFELRVLGAYSRHIRAGMRRVDASSSDPDLLPAAFALGPDRTMVLINTGSAPRSIPARCAAGPWREMERIGPEEENLTGEIDSPAGELNIAPGEILVLSTIRADGIGDGGERAR